MTTTPVHSAPVGTVVFERTIRVREYESAKAGIFIQFELPDPAQANGSYGDEVLKRVGDAFFQAKAAVYDELGIEFNVDEGGVVREALRNTFGNVTEVTASAPAPRQIATTTSSPAPAPAAEPQAATLPDAPPYHSRTKDPQEKAANTRWAKAMFEAHPERFWDNREDKASGRYSANSPDFKHKDSGVGVWLS